MWWAGQSILLFKRPEYILKYAVLEKRGGWIGKFPEQGSMQAVIQWVIYSASKSSS
jgi:hypothetical protein